jgi:uncharacterized protein (TIGR02266 family)
MARRKTTDEVPLDELKRYFRVPSPRGLPVDYPGRGILLESRITNVSNKGVFIATRSPFARGSRVRIEFKLPDVDRTLAADCVVRWSTATDPKDRPADYDVEGMGLEFTKISRKDKKALEKYISAFVERMRRSED